MVEDLLYQLCVEVNPSLDIHEVRLTVDGTSAPRTKAETEAGDGESHEALLRRLRGAASTLADDLKEDVLGQDRAVESVARAVRAAAAGLGERGRPLASFLFPGRTGTGKTELARCMAERLFAAEGRKGLVRIDCSEFALAHEYSKLIGSPPGYVGHDDGGQLTDAVAAEPECVVLFDEVEKAHPKLHNLMLQILEEGDAGQERQGAEHHGRDPSTAGGAPQRSGPRRTGRAGAVRPRRSGARRRGPARRPRGPRRHRRAARRRGAARAPAG